jgi:hypothetical protein
MKTSDFTTSFVVDETAEEVFNAVNNVRGWWSEEIEGNSEKAGDVFNYHYEDLHRCQMKLIEVVPNKKVVWLVVDNYFSFTKEEKEWKDTKVVFEISAVNGKTQLKLTHQGLVPEYECYDICKDGWTNYIQNSLRSLIATGKGKPNATGKPRTIHEETLRK